MKAEDLLSVAIAEIGYIEHKSNSQLDNPTANTGSGNWTKYARDLHTAGYYNGNKNGFAWCNVFADWCFYTAAGNDKAEAQRISCQSGVYGAVCTYSARYYKQAGRWGTQPKVGAQIYFGTADSYSHTGIVESYDSEKVYTIEGNADNRVKRNSYKLSNAKIQGYGYPLYDDEAEPAPVPEPTPTPTPAPKQDLTITSVNLFVLRKGSKHDAVRTLQRLLNANGAQLETDGEYGTLTKQAVTDYQKAHALQVDGVCGRETWQALINTYSEIPNN